MAESEKFCERIFEYFRGFEFDFVAELSDRPFSDWELIATWSPEESSRLRGKSECNTGFAEAEGTRYFFYLDENLYKLVDLKNDEIVCFDDRHAEEMDLRKVAEQLRRFMRTLTRH